MLDVTPTAATPALCDAAVCELSDAELDLVAAAGTSRGSLVNVSIGNIAVGFQLNNQINIAVLSLGSIQGGSQTNINNSGTIISYFSH